MNKAAVGFAVGLACLGVPSFAGQTVDGLVLPPLQYRYEPVSGADFSSKPALPPSLFVASPTVVSEISIQLPAVHVNGDRERNVFQALQDAMSEHDSLESCALDKYELTGHRRLEFLCAPEATPLPQVPGLSLAYTANFALAKLRW